MKNWLTIGQFAERAGFTPKALRLYEKMGLIVSHARGENDYRYYDESQLETAARIKELKDLGFTLNETKDLLNVDRDLNSEKLQTALLKRRELISEQADVLRNQKNQVEKILSSLREKSTPLAAEDRRAIMSFYGNVSIAITGTQGLDKTAQYTQKIFKNNGKEVAIYNWSPRMILPEEKPYILIVPEANLKDEGVSLIRPDVFVVKNLSEHSEENTEKYMRLFSAVGPHVTTIFNADDRASIQLAGQEEIRKGRIYYYSKNGNLEKQIRHIGGVMGDGEEVKIFGLNMKKEIQEFKLDRILAHEDEMAYLASVGAIMNLDFKVETLSSLK